MNTFIITAILVATAPGQQPDNMAAFFTPDGPTMCYVLADKLNDADTDVLFVCEVDNG